MDGTGDYYKRSNAFRRKNLQDIEENIRRHCLHRIVLNDGTEMEQLLHRVCSATYVEKCPDYIFRMDTARIKGITIFAQPLGNKQQYLQIIGYRINLQEE